MCLFKRVNRHKQNIYTIERYIDRKKYFLLFTTIRMNQNIQIRSANMLTEQENLAQTLSKISEENPAMIYRTTEFYANLLAKNLIVVASDNETNEIIGSGCLFPLAENFAEITCIHIDQKYL